ncbi:MAG TPA: hypothetical protein VGI98_00130 [Candidatus Limnocylindrales bacterium]|jgi:hypothetical protein
MSPFRRLGRLLAVGTLPETRRLIAAGVRPANRRLLVQRARAERVGLVREALRHPATAELANAGLLLLPLRYSPLGWAASWAIRRRARRA